MKCCLELLTSRLLELDLFLHTMLLYVLWHISVMHIHQCVLPLVRLHVQPECNILDLQISTFTLVSRLIVLTSPCTKSF